MLMHMLPNFMHINPMTAQMPPQMAHRFLGGQSGGQDPSNDGSNQHPMLGGSLNNFLKMLKKLNDGAFGLTQPGGGGGRPRELLGVSLSGGDPYVPKSMRVGSSGGKSGNKGRNNYGSNSAYNYHGGNGQGVSVSCTSHSYLDSNF